MDSRGLCPNFYEFLKDIQDRATQCFKQVLLRVPSHLFNLFLVPMRLILPLLITHNAPTYNVPGTCNGSLPNVVNDSDSLDTHLLKLNQLLDLGSFNVRNLMQTGKRKCLAPTMDVSYVCEIRRFRITKVWFKWLRLRTHRGISCALQKMNQLMLLGNVV